jgi:hypothetical protein
MKRSHQTACRPTCLTRSYQKEESRESCSQYNQFNHVGNENLVICIEVKPTATSIGGERECKLSGISLRREGLDD